MPIILEDGPIRRRLRERGGKQSPADPTITRSEMASLITEEEKAAVRYNELARNPVFTSINATAGLILISEDQRRHAETLKNILRRLEMEGKLV